MKPGSLPALALMACLCISACSQQNKFINPVEEGITESVYASGMVKAKNQYQLYATVSGIIKDVLVKEGDEVKKGSPIYRINNEQVRLSVENAQLAASFSAVENNQSRFEELKASLNFAASKYRTDSSLFLRQQTLWSQGIGTRNELEQRQLAMENSASNLDIAQKKYDELTRQIQFNAKQAKKNLEITKAQENDFLIKSESDGRVFQLMKEKGETVNPQQPIATLGDSTAFQLELLVDEYDIAQIKLNQQIIVRLDSYKGKVFEARISKINPIMDERTRSFVVEAVFTNSPEKLYPNLSVETNIVLQSKPKTLTIPRTYLVQDSFVLLENKEKRKVTTGLMDYRKVEITGGLTVTDKLIEPKP